MRGCAPAPPPPLPPPPPGPAPGLRGWRRGSRPSRARAAARRPAAARGRTPSVLKTRVRSAGGSGSDSVRGNSADALSAARIPPRRAVPGGAAVRLCFPRSLVRRSTVSVLAKQHSGGTVSSLSWPLRCLLHVEIDRCCRRDRLWTSSAENGAGSWEPRRPCRSRLRRANDALSARGQRAARAAGTASLA